MTLTPDEAKRLQLGETIEAELPLKDRLKAELDAGVYAGNPRHQLQVKDLLESWKGSDCEWISYMRANKASALKAGVSNVFDRIGDIDFWVRALAHSSDFVTYRYARVLMREHALDDVKQLQAA